METNTKCGLLGLLSVLAIAGCGSEATSSATSMGQSTSTIAGSTQSLNYDGVTFSVPVTWKVHQAGDGAVCQDQVDATVFLGQPQTAFCPAMDSPRSVTNLLVETSSLSDSTSTSSTVKSSGEVVGSISKIGSDAAGDARTDVVFQSKKVTFHFLAPADSAIVGSVVESVK